MDFTFAAYQIADLATEIEEASVSFYNQMSKNASEDRVKDLFTALSAFESEHIITFRGMSCDLKNDSPIYLYPINLAQLIKEHVSKIKSVFDSKVFSGLELDTKESLQIAIEAEETSIRIYSDIQANISEQFIKIFDRIISEERQHLTMLLTVKDKVCPPEKRF